MKAIFMKKLREKTGVRTMKHTWYFYGALSLIGAGLLGWFGWHFRDYGWKLGLTPQTLSAAELVAEGPGNNLNVRLTDCHLGEPVVETFKDSITDAWFPVYVTPPASTGKQKEIPPIIYHRFVSESPNEFEIARRHLVVQGVVANDLSGWPDRPSAALLQAYPGLESAGVLYVRESNIPLQYLVYIAWAGAVLLAGSAGLYFTKAMRNRPDEQGEAAQGGSRLSVPVRKSTDVVPVYHAAPGEVPPELKALGRAETIHKPDWIYRIGKEQPALALVIGLVAVGVALLVLATVPLNGRGYLGGGLALLGLVGLGFLALPFVPFTYVETYVIYPRALVIIQGDTFSVIRWDAIEELNHPRYIRTADGQTFGLATLNNVEGLGVLYDRVKSELTERLLPPLMATVDGGGTVTFGTFAVSRSGIGANGTTLPWSQVAQVTITANVSLGMRHLVVKERGCLLPTMTWELNGIRNDWLLLEVVRQVCPRRLLTAADAS
jgi:hypothetical protein